MLNEPPSVLSFFRDNLTIDDGSAVHLPNIFKSNDTITSYGVQRVFFSRVVGWAARSWVMRRLAEVTRVMVRRLNLGSYVSSGELQR